MKKKKVSKQKKKNFSFIIFGVFILLSALIVVMLEYLEYKNGNESFFFSKIITLENTQQKKERINQAIIGYLHANHLPFNFFIDAKDRFHFKIELQDDQIKPFQSKLDGISQVAKGNLVLAEVKKNYDYKNSLLYKIYIGKALSHLILIVHVPKSEENSTDTAAYENTTEIDESFSQPVENSVKGESKKVHNPKIAIIIDDVGNRDYVSRELSELNIPITAAIIPQAYFAREESERIHSFQLEQIIHLPMQPQNGGRIFSKKQFITIDSTAADIQWLIDNAKTNVRFALGINNHMGSLVTTNSDIMKLFFSILKQENLFYIDSRTTDRSIGYSLAKQMGVKAVFRDVFLDHEQSYEYSLNQIHSLIKIAQRKGKAVAIGHPFKSTIAAIKDSIALIQKNGIQIVFVSQLLE